MLRFPALLTLAAALTCAQTPKLPEPYQSIIELTHSVPPEFAANALLDLVESGKIAANHAAGGDPRRRMVEEAFRLADGATFQVRMRVVPGIPADTRSAFLGRAYALQLDALSLKSRAVKDMLNVDVPKARELFEQIPPPSLAPLSCDDALVYDLSNFYQALDAIVSIGFTAKERTRQDHISLLLGFIAQAASPLQFAPLANLIETLNVTPAQRETLRIRLNGMLEDTRADGRSLSALLSAPGQAPAQLQAFLNKNAAAGAGCPDDSIPTRATAAGDAQLPQTDSTPKLDLFWQSTEAQRLLTDGKKLRYNSSSQLLSDADRSAPEWRQQLADYLTELANWGPAQEKSEADYFHEKCLVFVNLIELIPPGSDRDEALAAFTAFVNNSSLELQSPVEWYLEANAMLERVLAQGNGEPNKVREGFEETGNPVLILSNALEKALGRKRPDWATPPASPR